MKPPTEGPQPPCLGAPVQSPWRSPGSGCCPHSTDQGAEAPLQLLGLNPGLSGCTANSGAWTAARGRKPAGQRQRGGLPGNPGLGGVRGTLPWASQPGSAVPHGLLCLSLPSLPGLGELARVGQRQGRASPHQARCLATDTTWLRQRELAGEGSAFPGGQGRGVIPGLGWGWAEPGSLRAPR